MAGPVGARASPLQPWPHLRAVLGGRGISRHRGGQTCCTSNRRSIAPCLTIVFGYGLSAASGFGSDLRRLYDQLYATTTTALVVDTDATWAATYGPIHRLADLREDSGVSAFLDRVAARYVHVVEPKPESPASANSAHHPQTGGDVYAPLLKRECGYEAAQTCTSKFESA